jgi:hypothetical protein
MQKSTATGQIVFTCECRNPVGGIPGTPEDTLMYAEYPEAGKSNLKYETFIENAPYDPAANRILRACPKCRLPYLVSIRVGVAEQVLYVCECGFKSTYVDFVREYGED